jgi:transcriptional regulator with PAS, ATPase and Fis domain
MPGKTPSRKKLPAEMISMLELRESPAILLDRHYRIHAANRAYQRIYGDGESLVNRYCYEVSHHYKVPCDQVGESCPLQACLKSETTQRVLHVHHTPRGEEHVDVETSPLLDEKGDVELLLEVMRQTRVASALPTDQGLVGKSPRFNRMLELVQRVAPTGTPVLLLGETGTGKELVARAIHDFSPRNPGPFVPVECSGLTETLFESELFGHEKGAFTGAQYRKDGLVDAARGGTLFLDEVGDIPLSMQVKLLRVLETGTFRRVGSVDAQQVDFRLVCATHRKLWDMVAAGTFREDLYYRISMFPIHLPALRERIQDLPVLIETLLARIDSPRRLRMHADTLACLQVYAFPGNVRELRNILERAVIMTDGDVILPEHLPEHLLCAEKGVSGKGASGEIMTLEEMERRYLRQVMAQFQGDRHDLARQLGVSDRTLYRKLNALR